ncbi:hypothetical protein Hanom_Chr11g01043741 [Helianthus anomalus]
MPLTPREKLGFTCRVPRVLPRVTPGSVSPLAWRGGDCFPAGPYLDLHLLPSFSFDQTLNFKMS